MSWSQPLPSLLWMAPILSGGGYSSEAIGFALGLAADKEHRIALRQFAEQADQDFVYGLDPEVRDTLSTLLERGSQPKASRGVVVCHATPDAWLPSKFPGWDALAPCPPPGAAYAVGRTMYETDSVPADWVARCEQMDEVWVPTEFHRETFAAAGVPMHKLVVVGEPVDTAFFDPAAHAPLTMPAGGDGPWALEHVGGDPIVYDVQEGLLAASVSAAGAVSEAGGAAGGAAGGRAGGGAGGGAGGAGGGGRPFRFLSVFKWEQRKGWDVLLSAFLLEFEAEAAEEEAAEEAARGAAVELAAEGMEGGAQRPRVELLLKTRPFHSDGNFGELVRSEQLAAHTAHAAHAPAHLHSRIPMHASAHVCTSLHMSAGFAAERGLPTAALRRVRILDEELALRALPRLYAAADAFVLPSRGEGWGRPHVEAMAMGLPVIATNWSAPPQAARPPASSCVPTRAPTRAAKPRPNLRPSPRPKPSPARLLHAHPRPSLPRLASRQVGSHRLPQ